MKHYDISNEDKDPIINSRWGYFVNNAFYREVLAQCGDQNEVCGLVIIHLDLVICF